MDKSQLRKLYLQKRSTLTAEEVGEMSDKICSHFFTLPFQQLKYIHTFYPISEKKEVDSVMISNRIRHSNPDLQLVLSKMEPDSHSLKHIVWDSATHLVKNRWGIAEPVGGKEISAEMLDMILIPLMVYDKIGNRVGYGKGYYDRFLAQCRPHAIKVGLSFFPPEELIEDTGQHDVALDICITPEKVWRFNK